MTCEYLIPAGTVNGAEKQQGEMREGRERGREGVMKGNKKLGRIERRKADV